MFFDAVLRKGSRIVLFNGTPEETYKYLRTLSEEDRKTITVFRGEDLAEYEVDVYLSM